MAIAFVDAQVTEVQQPAANPANFTATGTVPTGVASGNVILCSVSTNRGSTESFANEPTDQGYTFSRTLTDGAESTRHYWKVAGGSETAPAATLTNAGATLHSVIVQTAAYSGTHATTPILLENGVVEGASAVTTHTGPTLSNTDAAAWGVFVGSARQVATPDSWTPGAGLTERLDKDALITSANNHWTTLADTNATVATGNWTPSASTSTATAVATMWSVLLAPAGAAGPADVSPQWTPGFMGGSMYPAFMNARSQMGWVPAGMAYDLGAVTDQSAAVFPVGPARRWQRPLTPRSGSTAERILSQLVPAVAPYVPESRRRPARGLFGLRRRPAEVTPAQVVATPPPFTPDTRRRATRGFAVRRRRSVEVTPAQVVATPPPSTPDTRRRATRGFAVRRRRSVEVTPAQVVATPPPFTPDTRRRATRGFATRRRRSVEVTPVQVVATPPPYTPDTRRRAARGFVVRRRRSVEVTPVQVVATPPPFTPETRRRAARGFVVRRRRSVEVTPPQVVAAPPPYVAETRRRAARGFSVRRRRSVEVTPAQVVATPPPYVPTLPPRHALRGVPRRTRRTDVVAGQVAAPAPRYVPTVSPKRLLRGAPRRGRVAGLVPAQLVAPATPSRRRAVRVLRRVGRAAAGLFGISTTPTLLADEILTARVHPSTLTAATKPSTLIAVTRSSTLTAAVAATGAVTTGYLYTTLGNYVSAPDHTRLDVAGDLDVAVLIAPDDWHQLGTQGVLSKGNAYNLIITDATQFRLEWKDSGGTFHDAYLATGGDALNTQLVAGRFMWIRMTLDVDNGAGGRTISLYYSLPSFVPSWTLFSSLTQAGVTDVNNSTDPITVGTHGGEPFTGKIGYTEVRNGLAGTIVADPDWRTIVTGPGQTDAAGNVWTATGSPAFTALTTVPASGTLTAETSPSTLTKD